MSSVQEPNHRYTTSIAAFTEFPAYGQILLRQLLFTLGPFWSFINTQKSRINGVSHCALLLHVAMQFGLYHLLEQGAWRKVSEDSGESRSFLLIDCTIRFSLPLAIER